ncbi:hypothetical protein M0R45_016129 [Rubus argutus]|uniref:Secreted protein n=1 Tax=Rubus argutus TaxID=59490 RepID=A0AAW1XU56_RUBAR
MVASAWVLRNWRAAAVALEARAGCVASGQLIGADKRETRARQGFGCDGDNAAWVLHGAEREAKHGNWEFFFILG